MKRKYSRQSMSKGTFYLTIDNVVLVLTGYLIYIGLARFLGPEQFGIYGLIISFITLISMILTNGVYQAVSKFVSEKESKAEAVKRISLKIQLMISSIIFLVVMLLAKQIALMFNDISLLPYIRLSSFIIIFQALFSVFLGYLNGLRNFKMQAVMGIIYSILKLVLIFILVFAGLAVYGAVGGFVLAVFFMLLMSFVLFGFGKKDGIDYRKILSFAVPLMIFTILTNLLMNIDLFFVKALSLEEIANVLTGYYTAALTIARLPFFVIIPISHVLFPIISRSTFKLNYKKAGEYTSKALRYCFIFLIPCAAIVSSTSFPLVSLLYSVTYIDAALPLSILVFGLAFFSLFTVLSSVISGSGKPYTTMVIGGFIVLSDIILNYILIPKYQLVGAAVASTITMALGFFVCLIYVLIKLHAKLDLFSLARILFAGFAVFFLGRAMGFQGYLLLVEYIILGVVYLGILLLLKEFSKEDIEMVRKLV